ncbi:MAG: hypothetical protein LBL46_03920 [Rickettsiales bacterium]|jgi:hypothetical protein|nr:hypothetical protein [Rickettsiales bacterium]
MSYDMDFLTRRLGLTPFQSYVIRQNGYKYNMSNLKKFGPVVYAPYRCGIPRGFRDAIEKLLYGPRMDVIGTDRMLASDTRRVRLR